MKKILIAAIGVVSVIIVALVVLLAVGISKGGFDMSWGLRAELRNRQAFSAAEVDSLMVKYGSESIYVFPSDTDEIILEEYDTHWAEGKAAVTSLSGGTLKITQGSRPIMIGIFLYRESFVNIYVPSDWCGDMDIECSSGSVKAEEYLELRSMSVKCTSGSIRLGKISADADLHISANSGSIRYEALTAGGSIEMKCTSGSIKGGSLTAAEALNVHCSSGTIRLDAIYGDFEVSTTSGSVKISDVRGQGHIEAGSGSISIALNELTGDLSTKTTSGSIKIDVPENLGFYFGAAVGSGSIKTPFDDYLSYNKSGNEASGAAGDSPQHMLSCKAGSGSIRLAYS